MDLLINAGGSLDLGFVISSSAAVPYNASRNTVETDSSHCLKVGDKIHACGPSAGCPVDVSCITVASVTDKDSATLSSAPPQAGWISRAAELASKKRRHGFRPVLSLGEPVGERLLDFGGVNSGSDRVVVLGHVEWYSGDRIYLGDAFPIGAVITQVITRDCRTVVFVDRQSVAAVALSECRTARLAARSPKRYWGTSSDCGTMALRLTPKDLSEYLPCTRLPYKLELAWGWDYTEYNKLTGCCLEPSRAWTSLLQTGTAVFV